MNTAKDAKQAPADAAKGKKKPEEVDHELEGLMSEIESDLREDELKKIWNNYGAVIVAFVIAVVLGVGGVQFYRHYEQTQREDAGRRYEQAIRLKEEGKPDEALAAFADLAKDAPTGYATMARLSEAAIQIEKGNVDGALANYKALSENSRVDPTMRDLATLLTVLHSVDRADAKTLEAQLTPLINPNNAFNLSALELQALLAAKQGDVPRAIKTLGQITGDPGAPPSMRQRAEDLTKLYESGNLPPPPVIAPAAAPAAAAPPAAVPAAPAAPKP